MSFSEVVQSVAGMSMKTSIPDVVESGEKVDYANVHDVPTSAVVSPGGVCLLDSENTSSCPQSVDLYIEELNVLGLPKGLSNESLLFVGAPRMFCGCIEPGSDCSACS